MTTSFHTQTQMLLSNRHESALKEVVKLSKIVSNNSAWNKVDLERQHKAESRCYDFFVKKITSGRTLRVQYIKPVVYLQFYSRRNV